VTQGPERIVSGSEYVLVAQVPKAGDRWHQTHFNMDVTKQFFRVSKAGKKTLAIERVDREGRLQEQVSRPLVLSDVNLNSKIELDYGMVEGRRPDYPQGGPPIVVILELDTRTFRYQTLMPGDDGHAEMLELTNNLPSLGRGVRRVITSLDEVELRWPGCRLRAPA
jgi:hypothetical protein